uniref:DNA (cytosine-5-)-methyltransferase n=1 Tax=uncultured marine group II/III euryarchaeote KM3_69_H04 TaxID=1456492 RepID=A0A075HMF0_9EURY|nr:DNA-cytosine methyltransferase (DNMT, dcm) [uncultured marine group II/III euryarchaeote KM3_69_H04]
MRKLTSIDLFAGCGGLTRGLEWAGFECIAFNELNKDAADSFALNFPDAERFDGDISQAVSEEAIREQILPLAKGERIDLVCGGPPCQGYSGIGHRRTHHVERRDIPANRLFQEMIRTIEGIQPRAFLFENVQGILSGRWTSDGVGGDIFRDVWAAFSSIDGYVAQPTLLHGYGFGVPQNRPRVMIMGVREEIERENGLEGAEFDPSLTASSYHSQLRNNGGLFPKWEGSTAPDLVDVIGDLDFTGWRDEHKADRHRTTPKGELQKRMRPNARAFGSKTGVDGWNYGREPVTDHEFSNHTERIVEKFKAMHDNDGEIPEHMRTKKFSQKIVPARWGDSKPSMTVTSLPDDYVHYARPRTFSVREWARIQTFPDDHLFAGKRTTGGSRRAGIPSEGIWDREVPKYTQIGNAVPPLLAEAIGEAIIENVLES